MSKETYIYAKRPVSLQRDLYQCNETYRRPERLDVALGREGSLGLFYRVSFIKETWKRPMYMKKYF